MSRSRQEEPPSAAALSRLRELAEFRFQVRRFIGFSEAASEALGIPGQQYQMLQVVATMPADAQATISYIAERMVLRHNSTVELVTRAERAGLVRRVGDENDHRRSVVELTSVGRKMFLRLVEQHVQELQRIGPAITQALEKAIDKSIPADVLAGVAR